MHSRAEGRGLYGAWKSVCTVELRAGPVWCMEGCMHSRAEGRGLYGAWRGVCTVELRAGGCMVHGGVYAQ